MNSNLLRGTLETIVLKLLADFGPMYGYEMGKKAKEISKEAVLLTEGALYPTLHKLEAMGFLETTTRMENQRIRKYYKITEKGDTRLVKSLDDFKAYVDVMFAIMSIKPQIQKLTQP
jgi:DNA-binding PadR family transcriptional regulator